MKKLALFILGLLLFLNNGHSQKQQVKLKNPTVYEVGMKNDSLVFSTSEINLEVAEWVFDSCNYYANSFEFQFEIRNDTKKPIICNKELYYWNDSGLYYYGTLRSEPISIAPGKTEKIMFHVMPYHKRKASQKTEFVIMHPDKSILVPLSFKFECTSVKPCEKPIPNNPN